MVASSNSFNVVHTLCPPSHTFHTLLHMHDRLTIPKACALLTVIHKCWSCEAYTVNTYTLLVLGLDLPEERESGDIQLIPSAQLKFIACCLHSWELITALQAKKVLCHCAEVAKAFQCCNYRLCSLQCDWQKEISHQKAIKVNEARGISPMSPDQMGSGHKTRLHKRRGKETSIFLKQTCLMVQVGYTMALGSVYPIETSTLLYNLYFYILHVKLQHKTLVKPKLSSS